MAADRAEETTVIAGRGSVKLEAVAVRERHRYRARYAANALACERAAEQFALVVDAIDRRQLRGQSVGCLHRHVGCLRGHDRDEGCSHDARKHRRGTEKLADRYDNAPYPDSVYWRELFTSRAGKLTSH